MGAPCAGAVTARSALWVYPVLKEGAVYLVQRRAVWSSQRCVVFVRQYHSS